MDRRGATTTKVYIENFFPCGRYWDANISAMGARQRQLFRIYYAERFWYAWKCRANEWLTL